MSSSTGSGPAGLRHQFARATPVLRLLVLTQMSFNIGFYMVLPYLAVHLSDDLGLSVAAVGLLLGVRTFSQQGLFVVGGILADRLGTKPVVLTGCVVRVAGFLLLAAAQAVTTVVLATVLVGVAAALFSPAVEAEAARAADRPGAVLTRLEGFALFSAFGQIGAFTGPLVGALLLGVDFRASCLVAAAVFVAIALGHLRWLPREPGAHVNEPWLSAWRPVVGNRAFVLFTLLFSMQLVSYNQLYLLLPLEVERAWGSAAPLGVLYAVSSALVVLGQSRLTRRLQSLDAGLVLMAGMLVMATGFAVVGLTVPQGWTGAAALVPVAVFVVLLTTGQMAVGPVARDTVAVLARGRHLGAHYGVLSSAGGLAVLVGSGLIGRIVDVTGDAGPGAGAAWWAVAAGLTVSGVALGLLRRRT